MLSMTTNNVEASEGIPFVGHIVDDLNDYTAEQYDAMVSGQCEVLQTLRSVAVDAMSRGDPILGSIAAAAFEGASRDFAGMHNAVAAGEGEVSALRSERADMGHGEPDGGQVWRPWHLPQGVGWWR